MDLRPEAELKPGSAADIMKGMLTFGWAFALSSAAAAAPAPQTARPLSVAPEPVPSGAAIYDRNCSACHGTRMADPDGAFDLRTFPRDQHSRFIESVTHGKNSMPPWGDLLNPQEVEALWAYVIGTGTPAQGDLQAQAQDAKAVSPFRIFDNLFYVGIDWVSAYVLKTSEGLIMIDTLYGPFTEHALSGMKQLGLDPKDIKYALVTHAHFDHAEGAKVVHAASGARIGMTDADWLILEQDANATPRRDLVIRDGDTLTLGDTTLRFYVTPGHTPGVLSMEFPVRDRDATSKAFMFGGVGLNFDGVERTRMYIASVRRLMTVPGVQVNIPNHPNVAQVFDRAARLVSRKPGDPHPFLAPEDWKAWLQSLLEAAETKLQDESAR